MPFLLHLCRVIFCYKTFKKFELSVEKSNFANCKYLTNYNRRHYHVP